MCWKRVICRLISGMALVLLAGFLGAALVRFSPGFLVDERELDARLNASSIETIRAERASESDLFGFYGTFLTRALHGDLGQSISLNRPVSELLRERIPVTGKAVIAGLGGAWLLAMAAALPFGLRYLPWYDVSTGALAAWLLCLPSALIGLAFLFLDGPVSMALALVVCPKVFRYARNLILEASQSPHVMMAHAKGVSRAGVLVRHVVAPSLPQLISLAGVSLSMVLGAAIPIEVICDSPGIGQLAWLAAMGRDLPLLVSLTLFVTALTLTANSLAEAMLVPLAEGHTA